MGCTRKKLIEAARYWARGGKGEDSRLADLLVAGVPEAEAKAWLDGLGDPEPDKCLVWPCHWPALDAFLGLQSQWKRAPFGGLIGLDYAAIPAFFQLRGIPRKQWPGLFDKIQAMEHAALPLMNA